MSVVVPARNEEPQIRWAVGALRDSLDALVQIGCVSRAEVIVVDDHSTDATGRVVAEMAAGPGAHVRLVPAAGRGLGAAIRTGLAASTGDLVVYTDADLPFDPDDIRRLIRAADRYDADVACGYRFDRTGEGARRAAQSYAYNLLVRAVLPVTVRDVNFACKLLTRPAVDVLVPELVSDGPFIDTELMSRCAQHDFRIVQVGVDYFPRFDTASTLGGADAIGQILRDMRRQRRALRTKRTSGSARR